MVPEDPPQTFTDSTNIYLKALHSVDIRLKRQMYGLNEAHIISAEKTSSGRADGQNTDSSRIAKDRVALDVGWLNSRSGKVGRDMEAELWAKCRAFLEAMKSERSGRQIKSGDGGHENKDMTD